MAYLEIAAGLLAAFGAIAAGLHDWREMLTPATVGAFAIAAATSLRALNRQPPSVAAPASIVGEGEDPTDRP